MGNNQSDYSSFSVDPLELQVALQRAGHEARRRHALEGRSVPILRDGKIVCEFSHNYQWWQFTSHFSISESFEWADAYFV